MGKKTNSCVGNILTGLFLQITENNADPEVTVLSFLRRKCILYPKSHAHYKSLCFNHVITFSNENENNLNNLCVCRMLTLNHSAEPKTVGNKAELWFVLTLEPCCTLNFFPHSWQYAISKWVTTLSSWFRYIMLVIKNIYIYTKLVLCPKELRRGKELILQGNKISEEICYTK